MVTVSEATSNYLGNRRIAGILFNIATMLDLAQDNIYRVRAYHRAARRILALREDAAVLLARDEELYLPGVGKRIRHKLNELITTGRLAFYEELLEDQPAHVRALMAVEGIGPKTAHRLYVGLGVQSVEDLVAATKHNQVQLLFGFGEVREANLARGPRSGWSDWAGSMSLFESDLDPDDSDLIEPRQILAPLGTTGYGIPDLPLVGPEQALDLPLVLSLHPRPYQREAVRCWLEAEGRGVVVLPTGAGKTVVAMMAMEAIGARTLIVVPTIELLEQWRASLVERLGLPADAVGVIGGGRRDQRPITVITYQSAHIPGRLLGGFGLVVFDEVHHLPAAGYRRIPRLVGAPYLLGLSATTERVDGKERDLDALVGPEVYRKLPVELARDGHIAQFVEKRLFVDLTPQERLQYESLSTEYRWYMARRRGNTAPGAAAFQDLIRRSAVDPAARGALQAHHEARLIALNASAKIDLTAELLARHRTDKVIVFSEFNALVDRLSRDLLLPAITYRTPARERRQVLERFRSGQYSKLVTGRVLNEGVDVPDAGVAIVVSGSATTREYIQRLGRVLRPKSTQAILYELITRQTSEGRTAARRRPSQGRVA